MKLSYLFPKTNIIVFSLLTGLCTLFLLLPYLNAHLMLPRIEELYYSLYPLIIWAKHVLSGRIPLWFPDAALGVPWPIPHTMSHTPLMLLFGIMPVFQALSILVAVHIILQSYFTARLCTYFKLTPLITSVVLLSVLLASPMEYLIVSDAPAVYMTWTLLPIILYAQIKILEANDLFNFLRYSSLLALIIGYGILNFHNGVMSVYLFAMAFVVLFSPKAWLPRWYWFVFSGLLALGIGAEKIYILANELSYFGSMVERSQYDYGQNLFSGLWMFFLKPLVLTEQLFSQNYIDILLQSNLVSRSLTFDSPLCSILLVTYVIYYLAYKRNWPKISPLQKSLWLTVGVCIVAQFIPKPFLPVFVSAAWNFRDPVILIGLLLAGVICEEWVRPNFKKFYFNSLLLIHVLSVISCAFFFNYGINLNQKSSRNLPGVYQNITDESVVFPVHEFIEKALELSEKSVEPQNQTKRVVYDGFSVFQSFGGRLAKEGFCLNSLPLRGLQEVPYLCKGISVDSIHPAQSKPYGMISTLGFKRNRCIKNAYDWVQESPALLDLMGIRVVVGKDTESYLEHGLIRIGAVNPDVSIPSERIAVFANPHAFPRAFFVSDHEVAKVKRHSRCGENDNSLTCMNVDSLVQLTNPWADPVQVGENDNQISLAFSPSEDTRTLLLNTMWRPEWRAEGANIDSFYGLIKLTVPPQTSTILLEYNPTIYKSARWVTFICYGLALIFLFVTFVIDVKNKRKSNSQS